MGMGKPPMGFISVGRKRYAEFAAKMGLLPYGTHLEQQGKIIGWTTNKRFYVQPNVYEVLFPKGQPRASAGNDA